MLERLNGRVAVAIGAAALLLVLLVGWFGFVSPQRSKAAELALQIRETEARLVAAEALTRGSILQESTRQLATLRTAIPDEVAMPGLLRQLSGASAEARVRILGVTPSPVVANGAADAVPMSITLEGRYFGIRAFLRLLRTRAGIEGDDFRVSGRLFSIESIQFTGGNTANGLIQAQLAVTAYAFRGVTSVPVTGTAGTPAGSAPEAAGG